MLSVRGKKKKKIVGSLSGFCRSRVGYWRRQAIWRLIFLPFGMWAGVFNARLYRRSRCVVDHPFMRFGTGPSPLLFVVDGLAAASDNKPLRWRRFPLSFSNVTTRISQTTVSPICVREETERLLTFRARGFALKNRCGGSRRGVAGNPGPPPETAGDRSCAGCAVRERRLRASWPDVSIAADKQRHYSTVRTGGEVPTSSANISLQ